MKLMIAVGLAVLLGFALFGVLRTDGPFATVAFSQIYIHGTPVCVTRHPRGIVARVGECGEAGAFPDGGFHRDIPFHGRPGMRLPPGHPPIDGNLFPEENRRIPI